MFTVVLFTIARTWKHPKCPLKNEWIRKMWYIYTTEYYSAIKSNETESLVVMWMDLECVIQSEVSQKEKKQVLYINTYMWNVEKWYKITRLQGRNRDIDIENGYVDIAGEREGGMDWESITDIHTQSCVK